MGLVVAGQLPVMWALALFFLGLGFTARFDVPLALFAVTASIALGELPRRPVGELWREHWPLAVFLLAALLTTVLSVDPRHSLAVQPQLLPALLCYAVLVAFASNLAALRFICVSLLASGLLTATLMLVGADSGSGVDDPLEQVRMLGNALLIVPNDVLMLSVMAPLVAGVAWTGGGWLRVLAIIYLVLALVAGVMIESRQAVLLLIMGMVLLAGLMRPVWVLPLLCLGVVAGVLVDWLLGWPLAHKIFMFPRTYVWHTAWVMFLDRPWTGQGPGMFKDLYFPFLERAGYVLAELGDRRTMPWAHSLYLEQLAERGIPGLLALLALLGSAMAQAMASWRRAASVQVRAMAAGLLAAWLVFAAAGIAESTLSRLWVTVMLLLLAGFSRSLRACTD